MPFRIFVVGVEPDSRGVIERALSNTDHLVTYVQGFEEAKRRLQLAPPDLLVTALKLGAYNGLHLVLRLRSERPNVPAIVVHSKPDPALSVEAGNVDAVFVAAPFDEMRFAELVDRQLADTRQAFSTTVPRRWPRKQVAVRAKVGSSEATVVEVSYGGLRVEIDGLDEPLGLATVDIPSLGAMPVHTVWARGGGVAGRWWCGAEVDEVDDHASDAWRRFVDSLD
jgi:DNA-binding response OmpR family regulator